MTITSEDIATFIAIIEATLADSIRFIHKLNLMKRNDINIDLNNTAARSLLYSFIVAYSRPFMFSNIEKKGEPKTCWKLTEISNENLPELCKRRYSDLHNLIIENRNKLIAHTDLQNSAIKSKAPTILSPSTRSLKLHYFSSPTHQGELYIRDTMDMHFMAADQIKCCDIYWNDRKNFIIKQPEDTKGSYKILVTSTQSNITFSFKIKIQQ